jgi:hypothetical protein
LCTKMVYSKSARHMDLSLIPTFHSMKDGTFCWKPVNSSEYDAECDGGSKSLRRTNPLLLLSVALYSKLLNVAEVFLSLLFVISLQFTIGKNSDPLRKEIYAWNKTFKSNLCWQFQFTKRVSWYCFQVFLAKKCFLMFFCTRQFLF